MRLVAKTSLIAIVLGYGWLVTASAIYCAGTDKLELFRFPFIQWIQAAPWWLLNLQMTLWVIASAAVPSVLLIVCGISLIRFRKASRTELYGKTGWATAPQMKAGGLRLRDKL